MFLGVYRFMKHQRHPSRCVTYQPDDNPLRRTGQEAQDDGAAARADAQAYAQQRETAIAYLLKKGRRLEELTVAEIESAMTGLTYGPAVSPGVRATLDMARQLREEELAQLRPPEGRRGSDV